MQSDDRLGKKITRKFFSHRGLKRHALRVWGTQSCARSEPALPASMLRKQLGERCMMSKESEKQAELGTWEIFFVRRRKPYSSVDHMEVKNRYPVPICQDKLFSVELVVDKVTLGESSMLTLLFFSFIYTTLVVQKRRTLPKQLGEGGGNQPARV